MTIDLMKAMGVAAFDDDEGKFIWSIFWQDL